MSGAFGKPIKHCDETGKSGANMELERDPTLLSGNVSHIRNEMNETFSADIHVF